MSDTLRVAVIHYHLGRGGVTRVIETQLAALAAGLAPAVTVLHGAVVPAEPIAAGEIDLEVRTVEGLGYDTRGGGDPAALARRIEAVLADRGLEPGSGIVHVHNHALGKNAALPGALSALAARGHRLLLQLHDFAEDFRPGGYAHLSACLGRTALDEQLYPLAPQVHYAVINPRDAAVLAAAGVPGERVHLLPNAVSAPGTAADADAARAAFDARHALARGRELLLYPVRGIRRKNLGEALLWSSIAPDTAVATTLSPANPLEQPAFERWKALATSLGLPFMAGVGDAPEQSFESLLAAADRILTTSVAEGFGLVFLEPWLRGRDLCGRDLPEITADLVRSGVDLGALASELRVPVDWPGARDYRDGFERTYRGAVEGYGRAIAAADLARDLDAMVVDGCIDFARLGSAEQSAVVSHATRSTAARDRLRALNARALERPEPADSEQRIARNRAAVAASYGEDGLRARIERVYRDVMRAPAAPPAGGASSEAVLDAFLSPARFHPVRLDG